MATYKVLQDIEAEDTLVGPLTLRQCIYAAIAILAGFLTFTCISKGVPLAGLVFLPFIAFGLFFAFPWSKQQPTEVWALAKIRFYFKPRKRIWNQTGTKQLVTITVPKVVKVNRTKNLTPAEVQSRLRALADTIDSRGWAVKNIALGYYNRPNGDPDRLLDASGMPQEVSDQEAPSDDIFDTANNPVAHKLDMMMNQAAGSHHQQLMQQTAQEEQAPAMEPQAPAAPSYWHMKTIQPPTIPVGQPVAAGYQPGSGMLPPVDYGQVRSPAAAAPMMPPAAPVAETPAPVIPLARESTSDLTNQQNVTNVTNSVTADPNPAILELANNNDLNVATIAREAQARQAEAGEVVVDLH